MKILAASLSLLLAVVGAAKAQAATGPNAAITSPASGFSTLMVQGASLGVSAPVSSAEVNFVTATSTNSFTNKFWRGVTPGAKRLQISAQPRPPMK